LTLEEVLKVLMLLIVLDLALPNCKREKQIVNDRTKKLRFCPSARVRLPSFLTK